MECLECTGRFSGPKGPPWPCLPKDVYLAGSSEAVCLWPRHGLVFKGHGGPTPGAEWLEEPGPHLPWEPRSACSGQQAASPLTSCFLCLPRNSPGPGHGPLSPLPREVLLPESAQHLRQGTWGELRETTPRGACFRQGLPASAGGGCPPGPSSVSVCLQELPRPVLPVPRASHVLSAESQRLPDGPSEAWRKGRCPAVARRGGSLCGGPDHFERPGPAWPGGVGARTRGQLRGPAQPAEHAALRVLWRRPGRVGLRPGPRLHHGRRLPLRGPLAGRRFGSQVDVGQGEGPVAQPAPGGQPHGRCPSELPGQSDGGWDRDAAHHGHSPASFRRRPCGAWPGPPA